MKLIARCGLLAVLVATAAMAVAGPASATVNTAGNNNVTLDLKAGTQAKLTGTFAGVGLVLTCTTFSISGTKDAGDAVTGKPTFAGCSGTLAGKAVTCLPTSPTGWSLTSSAKLSGTTFALSAVIKAVSIPCTYDSNKAPCTFTVPAQTVPNPANNTALIWTNSVSGTLTANPSVKNITMAADCIGVAASGVTGSFTADWQSNLNKTVTLS